MPNLSGRVPVGAGTGAQQGVAGSGVITGGTALTARTRGQFFGDERLQAHTHTGTTGTDSPDHSHSTNQTSLGETAGMYHRTGNFTFASGDTGGGGGAGSNLKAVPSGGASARHSHTFTTDAHNQAQGAQQNLVPSVVTNYIIKI